MFFIKYMYMESSFVIFALLRIFSYIFEISKTIAKMENMQHQLLAYASLCIYIILKIDYFCCFV